MCARKSGLPLDYLCNGVMTQRIVRSILHHPASTNGRQAITRDRHAGHSRRSNDQLERINNTKIFSNEQSFPANWAIVIQVIVYIVVHFRSAADSYVLRVATVVLGPGQVTALEDGALGATAPDFVQPNRPLTRTCRLAAHHLARSCHAQHPADNL